MMILGGLESRRAQPTAVLAAIASRESADNRWGQTPVATSPTQHPDVDGHRQADVALAESVVAVVA